MAKQISIQIEGIEELEDNIDKVSSQLIEHAKKGMEKAMVNTADDIKVVFKGGSSPGFKDRTGALRASIRGGLFTQGSDDVIGFVGAGDETVGSDGRATRDYVQYIEFGEFSKAGSTSFLRSGVMQFQKSIADIIKEELNPESWV